VILSAHGVVAAFGHSKILFSAQIFDVLKLKLKPLKFHKFFVVHVLNIVIIIANYHAFHTRGFYSFLINTRRIPFSDFTAN